MIVKNVEPNGRSFASARPFKTAAIACSRMPKCMLRPLGVVGPRSPAPSNVRRVLVEGARSAEPPTTQAFRVRLERRQVAIPAVGEITTLDAVDLVGELGVFAPVAGEHRRPLL